VAMRLGKCECVDEREDHNANGCGQYIYAINWKTHAGKESLHRDRPFMVSILGQFVDRSLQALSIVWNAPQEIL
jgi:hypothetical protein